MICHGRNGNLPQIWSAFPTLVLRHFFVTAKVFDFSWWNRFVLLRFRISQDLLRTSFVRRENVNIQFHSIWFHLLHPPFSLFLFLRENFKHIKRTLLITRDQEKRKWKKITFPFRQILVLCLKRSSNVIRMLSRSLSKSFFFYFHLACLFWKVFQVEEEKIYCRKKLVSLILMDSLLSYFSLKFGKFVFYAVSAWKSIIGRAFMFFPSLFRARKNFPWMAKSFSII